MTTMLKNIGRRISSTASNLGTRASTGATNAASSTVGSMSSDAFGAMTDALGPVVSGGLNFLEKFSSPKALIGIGAAATALGAASVAGPASMDLAMTSAFGDSNADRYFMGKDISARFMAGSLIGGPLGTATQFSSPQDYFMANPLDPGPNVAIGAAAGLGAAGGAVGAFAGSGIRGRVGGAMAGAAIGTMAGGAAGMAPAYNYASSNREFLRTSPYSNSRSNALALNADGNIVLGMHNSRRSY